MIEQEYDEEPQAVIDAYEKMFDEELGVGPSVFSDSEFEELWGSDYKKAKKMIPYTKAFEGYMNGSK